MSRILVTAAAALLIAPAAAPSQQPVCERGERVVRVCDPLKMCWNECASADGTLRPSTKLSPDNLGGSPGGPGGPGNPGGIGNPGNAKDVGRAGEKSMDNESDRSGTQGRKGERDKRAQ